VWVELTLISPRGGPGAPSAVSAEGVPVPVPPEEETRTTIFAKRKAVGVTEFYQAQQAGYTAEMKVEAYRAEYGGQQLAEHEGKRYKVIRVGDAKNPDMLTLTLSDLPQGGGGMHGFI